MSNLLRETLLDIQVEYLDETKIQVTEFVAITDEFPSLKALGITQEPFYVL